MLRILFLLLIELLFAQVPPSFTGAYPTYIAHAGGAIGTLTYTSSLEAFNENYKKNFRFFETDVETTSDNVLVLLHDWDYSIEHFYHTTPKVYSLQEFKKLKLQKNLTQLTWGELAAWTKKHPDVHIIIDTKRNTLSVLEQINKETPEIQAQLIPQIYVFSEYEAVKKIGYEKIILTLYASDYKDKEVIKFVDNHRLWAVTMPLERAEKGTLASNLKKMSIPSYTHTVNSSTVKENLEKKGIFGFYTDFLHPGM